MKGFDEIYNFAVEAKSKFRKEDQEKGQKQTPKTCDTGLGPKMADFRGPGVRLAQAGRFFWIGLVVSFPTSTRTSKTDTVCKSYARFTEGVSKLNHTRT